MFPDRADLPFDSDPCIDGLQFHPTGFGTQLWSTRWYSWVVMSDLALKGNWLDHLGGFNLLGHPERPPWIADPSILECDISELRTMAIEERADAFAESLAHGVLVITTF